MPESSGWKLRAKARPKWTAAELCMTMKGEREDDSARSILLKERALSQINIFTNLLPSKVNIFLLRNLSRMFFQTIRSYLFFQKRKCRVWRAQQIESDLATSIDPHLPLFIYREDRPKAKSFSHHQDLNLWQIFFKNKRATDAFFIHRYFHLVSISIGAKTIQRMKMSRLRWRREVECFLSTVRV